MKIAVLIASFNRVATTLRGLNSLHEAARHQDLASLDIFLVDDASPDHTGAIVAERFPEIKVLQGTGNLFWNRGMCRAYAAARVAGPYDGYLLFNDDVLLMPDALQRLLSAFVSLNRKAVIAGAMMSASGKSTYAGIAATSRFRPMAFSIVPPDGTLRECDTFNGNFTIVPGPAMDAVGGLDPAYHHALGDIDLGLMLRKRGCQTFLLPEPTGICEHPPLRHHAFGARLRRLFVPPLPISDQIHLTYKRFAWPLASLLAIAQVARRILGVLVPSRQ